MLLIGTFTSSFAGDCESRNHIFLIHGIGGGGNTFGSMDQYLNKINACNKAKVFTYNTGDSALSTYNFSDDLNSFIEQSFNENKIGANDKISLIMHSQGGIVGSLWLLKLKRTNRDLYSKVDSFITLSTPYWGSTMAIVGEHFFFTLPEELDNPISPMGKIELKEMSHGSATISVLQQNFDDIYTDTHIRFLAIGGLKRKFNPYYGEDDTTVSAYSSNPNHFSITEDVRIDGLNAMTESSAFRRSHQIPFIPVTATHFKIEIPGVAKLDDSCVTTDVCEHPSIDHVVRHLNGEAPQANDEGFKFRKYRVNVYLKNWEGIVEDKDEVVVSLVKPHGETENVDFGIRRGRMLSTSFSGILKNHQEHEIKMIVKLKGKVIKVINAPVKGGQSTFVNLNLQN